MKTHFLLRSVCFLFFAFVFNQSFSQTSYIVKNGGEKIFIDDSEAEIVYIDKRIEYRLPGKTWLKNVQFKDLDYTHIGKYYLQGLKIGDAKKAFMYFVMAEVSNKKLLGVKIPTRINNYSGPDANSFYIIDDNNNILESFKFRGIENDKNNKIQLDMLKALKIHFADCKEIMDKLNRGDIDSIIDNLTYTICN